MGGGSDHKDNALSGEAKTRREACELYARAFGGEVERLLHSSNSGRAVLLFQEREIASVSFGPETPESFAWQELSQVALGIVRYERLRSRP